MDDQIHLKDFIEIVSKEINEFYNNWQQNNSYNPENWPIRMPPAEWYEQLRTHLENSEFRNT